jgi:hypothetical protein
MKLMTPLLKMAFLSLIVLAFSCSSKEEAPDVEISSSEIAEEIGATLSSDVVGLALDIETLSADAENGRAEPAGRVADCGVSYDTTFTKIYEGLYVNGEQTVSYAYELTCNNKVPNSLVATFSSMGLRSSARLTSSSSSSGSMTATGIQPTSATYELNGTIARNAEIESATKSYTSTSNISLSALTISKSTMLIASGTATYTYQGTTSGGRSFSYTASVIFNGDGTATIDLNDDRTFLVNLETGEVTEQT